MKHVSTQRDFRMALAQRPLLVPHSPLFPNSRVYRSSLVPVPLLSTVGCGICIKSNIQTWYGNYHMPPRVHAPWIQYHDLMEFWVFPAGVWVSVFCVCGRVIQILMISRTGKTTFINILAQLYRVLPIFTRPNFPVPFCFGEVRWLFLANEMGDKRCGHFRITAFNSWCKTADFTSPHLHVSGSVSHDGALSD